MFVFSGFEPSVLKLNVPLNADDALRRPRRVLHEDAGLHVVRALQLGHVAADG